MINIISKEADRVLHLLKKNYRLKSPKGLALSEEWLLNHPQQKWTNLEEFLLMNGVVFRDGRLQDVYPSELYLIIKEMRSPRGLKIGTHRYKLRFYSRCFVGSEAFEWLVYKKLFTKEKAMALGKMLVYYGVIHHVFDDHDFKNEYLFYRFYLDEKK